MADDEVNPLGTPTTNYGWTKPAVGGDVDAWGGMLNADLDGIDSVVHGIDVRPGYTLPTASTTVLGGVKVDGSTVTISGGGVISSAAGYTLPTASTTVLGGVKVDGTTVAISGGGVISAAGAVAVSATAPSSPVAGSLWFDTNGGQMYVWYNDGTSSQWVPVVNQGSSASSASSVPLIVAPPAAASWTQRNFGGATTVTDVANGVKLFDSSSAGTTNTVRGISLPSPTAPYTIDARISVVGLLVGPTTYLCPGLGWTDGTKLSYMEETIGNGPMSLLSQTLNFTNFLSFSASPQAYAPGVINPDNLFMRLVDDGTNVFFYRSVDGVTYLLVYAVSKASGFLGASGYSNPVVALRSGQLGNAGSAAVIIKSWWVH